MYQIIFEQTGRACFFSNPKLIAIIKQRMLLSTSSRGNKYFCFVSLCSRIAFSLRQMLYHLGIFILPITENPPKASPVNKGNLLVPISESLEELAFRDHRQGPASSRSVLPPTIVLSAQALHSGTLWQLQAHPLWLEITVNVLYLTSSVPRLPGYGFSLFSWQKRNKTKKACLFFCFFGMSVAFQIFVGQ